jgi:hypothetical protein
MLSEGRLCDCGKLRYTFVIECAWLRDEPPPALQACTAKELRCLVGVLWLPCILRAGRHATAEVVFAELMSTIVIGSGGVLWVPPPTSACFCLGFCWVYIPCVYAYACICMLTSMAMWLADDLGDSACQALASVQIAFALAVSVLLEYRAAAPAWCVTNCVCGGSSCSPPATSIVTHCTGQRSPDMTVLSCPDF